MEMDIEKLATSADKQPFWGGYLCAYFDSSKR